MACDFCSLGVSEHNREYLQNELWYAAAHRIVCRSNELVDFRIMTKKNCSVSRREAVRAKYATFRTREQNDGYAPCESH
jgi:hypothetical protein